MNVMMKLWKQFTKNHKGFSLVELICAVAVLSIVIAGAGSAMVISARSYQRGSTELDLQQQAQIASNLLTNLIIDADEVVQASDNTLMVKKTESGTEVVYTISWTETKEDGSDEIIPTSLTYHTNIDPEEEGILAENITKFEISQVTEGKNVDFSLMVKDAKTGRTFESDYHVTPRNGVSGSTGSTLAGAKSIWVENELVLEPNEEYDLNVLIAGVSNQGYMIDNLTGKTSSDTDVVIKDMNTATIKVGKSEQGSGPEAMFTFDVKPLDPSFNGTSINVKVYVRRVNDITVDGEQTSGSNYMADSYYKVTASLAVPNSERKVGAWYDVNYVNPYEVTWDYVLTGGEAGKSWGDYIEIVTKGVESNVPYVIFKLKRDMEKGCKLEVWATALHPQGLDPEGVPQPAGIADLADAVNKTNKTGKVYYDLPVKDHWDLENRASAWKRNGSLDIGLALDDSYFYIDEATGQKTFMNLGGSGKGELIAKGYSKKLIEPTDPCQFNFFNTKSDGGFVTTESTHGDVNCWNMILNTKSSSSELAYSSPYFKVGDYDNPGWGNWIDIYYYEVSVECIVGEGDHAGEDKSVEAKQYFVEDVAIKYKNTSDSNDWYRTDKVYVTMSDSLEKYKIYYTFDAGWEEGTKIYFEEPRRFVGVVHDEHDDYKDIRCDIPVLNAKNEDNGDYIFFELTAEKKQECMQKTSDDDGIIREIYEYNPFFGYPKKCIDPWTGVIPDWVYSNVSEADQNEITGCEGEVEFHFVDENINNTTGVTLKTMYCPTPREFSELKNNKYYVSGICYDGTDINIKIEYHGNDRATYTEESGGTITEVHLSWNGSKWITE